MDIKNIDFSNFSLGDLIWMAQYALREDVKTLAFKVMLNHPNVSVKYIYEIYKKTEVNEIKKIAREYLLTNQLSFIILGQIFGPGEIIEIEKN